jgi:hypothetical protein
MITTLLGEMTKINLDKKTGIINSEETTAIYNLIHYFERGENYGIYSW